MTSKAAANHLVRELAIELAPLVRVNGVAPATVVQGSAMFPRDRVIGSLAKYNIPYKDDEATDSLVMKLAQFYADRTLTKAPITPADQAEAYFLLVTQRLSKTTGQVVTVELHLYADRLAISLSLKPDKGAVISIQPLAHLSKCVGKIGARNAHLDNPHSGSPKRCLPRQCRPACNGLTRLRYRVREVGPSSTAPFPVWRVFSGT